MFATFAALIAAAHAAALRVADLEVQYIELHAAYAAYREAHAADACPDYEEEDVCYCAPMGRLQDELILARRENDACQRALILAERREEKAERKQYRAEHRRAA